MATQNDRERLKELLLREHETSRALKVASRERDTTKERIAEACATPEKLSIEGGQVKIASHTAPVPTLMELAEAVLEVRKQKRVLDQVRAELQPFRDRL